MPTPYADVSRYLSTLAAYGTNGATPSSSPANATYKKSQEQDSVANVTLTGVVQGLATINPTLTAGEHLIITAVVAATFTGPGTSQLDVQIIVDGVVVAEGVNEAAHSGATVSLTTRVSPAAGLHAISIGALATGDGTLAVLTGDAKLIVETTSV